jgi:hypothetical protein
VATLPVVTVATLRLDSWLVLAPVSLRELVSVREPVEA